MLISGSEILESWYRAAAAGACITRADEGNPTRLNRRQPAMPDQKVTPRRQSPSTARVVIGKSHASGENIPKMPRSSPRDQAIETQSARYLLNFEAKFCGGNLARGGE